MRDGLCLVVSLAAALRLALRELLLALLALLLLPLRTQLLVIGGLGLGLQLAALLERCDGEQSSRR